MGPGLVWGCTHTHLLTLSCLDSLLGVSALLGPSPPQGQGLLWSLPDSHLLNTNTGLKSFSGALGGGPSFPFISGRMQPCPSLLPLSEKAWAWYPPPLTKEEGAKHVHSGDDKAKDAMGATLDQMDPGVPLEELVWTQSAHYFLRTCNTALYTWRGQEVQRGLQ